MVNLLNGILNRPFDDTLFGHVHSTTLTGHNNSNLHSANRLNLAVKLMTDDEGQNTALITKVHEFMKV
jgi:hypothetical protein